MHPAASANIIASRSVLGTRVGALAALIATLMTSSLVWILADRSVWPWDQAWYGEVALDLWHARHDGLSAWLSALVHAIGAKPPLLVWLGQFFIPLSALTGDIESSLLLLNVAAAFATLTLIASAAADLGVDWRGRTAAVLVCGGASLFIGMTHQFMVEMLQALGVAAALLLAARARRLPFIRTAALGVLVAGAAVLAKASSVLFVAPLLSYAVVTSLCERRNRSPVAPGDIALGLASAACAAAAVAWYMVNWRAMLAHAVASTTGDAALLYGSPPSLGKLSFWTNALAFALAPVPWIGLAILILVAAALAVALFQLPRRSKWRWLAAAIDDGTLLAMTLAATIVATLLVYSMQINEETRLITPLLPIAAVLVGWSLHRLDNRFVAGAVILFLAANAVVAHLFAHGFDPFHLHPSPWLKEVARSDEDRSTLTRVVAQTCPPAREGALHRRGRRVSCPQCQLGGVLLRQGPPRVRISLLLHIIGLCRNRRATRDRADSCDGCRLCRHRASGRPAAR
jgi:hypothetical protein